MSKAIGYDFIVVGGGIAGASIAAQLAPRARVAILEMESQPGYHSTGRSAALFSTIYGNAVIRALSRASQSFLFDPPPGFAPSPLVSPRDTLFFARGDQLDLLERFRSDEDVRTGTDVLDLDDAGARVPLFKPGYLGGALLDRNSADIDVNALHQGYLRLARKHGAEVHPDCAVTGLERSHATWRVKTTQGDFTASVIVNAAGAWGDAVARLAGAVPVGLRPLRRTALLIDVPGGLAGKDWPAAIAVDESFYFKPDAGLLLLSPADEEPSPPCDAQPEELEVAIAIDRFENATGASVGHVRHQWAGLRVFSPDRTPVVGFDPHVDGFFWLVGQGGYGIQTAQALGRVAAALACNESIPRDVAAFGVEAAMLARSRF
jgi:D-arginine dehydrogenase